MSTQSLIALEILRLDHHGAKQGMATRALVDGAAARLALASIAIGVNALSAGEIAHWVAQMWGAAYHAESSQVIDCFVVNDTPELGCASFILVSHETIAEDLEAAERAQDHLKSRFGSTIVFESNGARVDGEKSNLPQWASLHAERLNANLSHRKDTLASASSAFSERSPRPSSSGSLGVSQSNSSNSAHPQARSTPPKPLTPDMITDGA